MRPPAGLEMIVLNEANVDQIVAKGDYTRAELMRRIDENQRDNVVSVFTYHRMWDEDGVLEINEENFEEVLELVGDPDEDLLHSLRLQFDEDPDLVITIKVPLDE